MNKGDKAYTAKEVSDKLSKHWKTKGPWTLIPLERGFYEMEFSSDDDLRNSFAMGTVNLKPGLLRLSRWTKDFNKYSLRLTHAQVWIRLLDLPQEYWLGRTLMEIAAAIGTPLIIDTATQKRTYGHYARVLGDIDFSRHLFYEIMVQRVGYSFPVEVEYEWLPEFCTHCQILGHSVNDCRWLHPDPKDSEKARKVQDKGKQELVQHKQQKQKWQPRIDNPSGVGSSLAFAKPISNASETNTAVPLEQPAEQQFTDSVAVDKNHDQRETSKDLDVIPVDKTNAKDSDSELFTIAEQQHKVSVPAVIHLENHETDREHVSIPIENTDKPAASYHFALENVSDEFVHNDEFEHTEPVLQPVNNGLSANLENRDKGVVQAEPVVAETSVALQLNEEEGPDGESDAEEILVDSPVSKSHPFVTVIPHRCPIITKDLETIQKALVGSNVADEDGFTEVVSKSSRKKKKGYQTHSRGPLPKPTQ